MRIEVPVPKGYVRADEPRGLIIAREDAIDGILTALRGAPPGAPTLHGFAAAVPTARPMQGRATAYAITLPVVDLPVVVRHNQHGGALRAITGDLFFAPTRAPGELDTARALHALAIPSPAVVAYGVYPASAGLARADVITEEIPDSVDLGALLLATDPESDERRRGWNATRRLLKRLASAGVRHLDLNVKNVLLRRTNDDLFAGYVLDVDRVEFDSTRRDAYAANRARLRRSVEKWRDTRGAKVTALEIEALRRTVPSNL